MAGLEQAGGDRHEIRPDLGVAGVQRGNIVQVAFDLGGLLAAREDDAQQAAKSIDLAHQVYWRRFGFQKAQHTSINSLGQYPDDLVTAYQIEPFGDDVFQHRIRNDVGLEQPAAYLF